MATPEARPTPYSKPAPQTTHKTEPPKMPNPKEPENPTGPEKTMRFRINCDAGGCDKKYHMIDVEMPYMNRHKKQPKKAEPFHPWYLGCGRAHADCKFGSVQYLEWVFESGLQAKERAKVGNIRDELSNVLCS